MELTLLLMITTLLIILIIFFISKQRKVCIQPPGPPGLPFIGNLLQLDTSNLHEYFTQLSKTYGPLMSMKIGSKRIIVLSSSKIVEEALKKQDLIFCDRPKFLTQQKLSYQGLNIGFAPYGEHWREMRKISVLHLLSTKRVQSFRTIREDEVSRMIKKISEAASQSKITNLSETIISLTTTITCRTAFGKRYDEEDQERRNFSDLLKEVQAVMVSFYFTDHFPLLGWIDKISGAITRQDNVLGKYDMFFQELIDNHLDKNRPKSMDNDIIDILLKLREDKSSAVDLTMDHIKAFLPDVFFPGIETTAATIVWAMTALIKSSSAMEKVQAEIRKVVVNKEMVDEDDCQKLPYLKAVIKEIMRLYPPAPLFHRQTIESCIIDGYEIQPKTMVYVNLWAIGRNSEDWEKPNEFLPERFLNSNIDLRGQDFMLIPFGAGRRICAGISMALANIELVLANLLYSFEWSLPTGMKQEDIDTEALPGITMHKKSPLLLYANHYNT